MILIFLLNCSDIRRHVEVGVIIDRTLSLTALTRNVSCLEYYGQLGLYFKRLDNRYHTIVYVFINV